MSSVHLVDDLGNFAEWACTVVLIAFVVQYSLYAKWWANPIGQTVVALDLCVLILLIPSDIGTLWPSWSFLHGIGYVWFEVGLLFLVLATMLWRMAVWQAVVRSKPRGDRGDEGSGS